MATKAVNLKMDENEIRDIKEIASAFHMTMTEVVKNAVDEYISKLKQDPYYRLTANVENADQEESQEVLDAIEGLSDDDLEIASVKHFKV